MRIHQRFVWAVSAVVVWTGWLATLQARQDHLHSPSQTLVDAVRAAIAQFSDPADAVEHGGYVLFPGCVSSPQDGAMGVHYVNPTLIGDGVIDERYPEALVYEPRNGRLQLVAAEFIVIADQWNAGHPPPMNEVPTLMRQMFHFNPSPNRYRLPAFYELHVWADKTNPSGAFADFNPHVSCDAFAPNP